MTAGKPHSPRGARIVEVAAQAKINLRLRILAREASGYHQLETLFLRIDLADTVRVRRTSGDRSLDVAGEFDPAMLGPVEKNLAWRAAEAYFAARGARGGFAIELTKRIPIGGGLGGGSADAGAVLRALGAMEDAPIESRSLLSLAAGLGADVTFLATEHAYALAWGRGERMLALTPPPSRDLLLVVPQFAVKTAEAFGWLADPEVLTAGRRSVEAELLRPELLSSWEALETLVGNDFEGAVGARHPEIDRHLDDLRSAGCGIRMLSGSGSTVFGVWTSTSLEPSPAKEPFEPDASAKYIRTRSSMRVEQVSVIE